MKHLAAVLGTLFSGGTLLFPAEPNVRYALILKDPPVAVRYSSLERPGSAGVSYRQRVLAQQNTLKQTLLQRNIRVTGAVQTVLNAVFVEAPRSREAELRSLPGVQAVAPLRRYRLHLNKAAELVNAPAAWSALGGTNNAGAGVKIAVIDTGIDQTHPAFRQTPPAPKPSGFPKCAGDPLAHTGDCAFTNAKVIVARSYLSPPSGSGSGKADDFTPRDHVGHGTAVASIAAGNTNSGPVATITGIAPQAFLGNYKVFGTPGVNDFATGDSIITAIDDAISDGMDIAVMSLGSTAIVGPIDTGAICGGGTNDPCDPEALAVDNAVKGGMLVVASDGNSGDSGEPHTPTLNTVETPATAPSAIAAGASTNSHLLANAVKVAGNSVPSNLQQIVAESGNGPMKQVTAPVYDVMKLDGDGNGCIAFPPNSLSGFIAIITRGSCQFITKVMNAQNAGAAGVIMVNSNSDALVSMGLLESTEIPAVFIGRTDGTDLRDYASSHSDAKATIVPTLTEFDNPLVNEIADFSSRGPSITYLLKPELVAVGTDIYMAAGRFDPNGALYAPSGYTVAAGTSFSAPMVAGGAALVKQATPGLSALQLKSAVVDTATQDITDNGQPAGVTSIGGGKLDVGTAIQTTVTSVPATIAFGALGQTANTPAIQKIDIHYSGTTAATLNLTITGQHPPTLDKTSLTFSPGQADQEVNLTVAQTPPPGIYSGAVTITGGKVPVRVPYLYVVGDGQPYNAIPLSSTGFTGTVGRSVPEGLMFKIVDQFGVSVPNLPVTFTATAGGGSIRAADQKTDIHGVATADGILGPTPGFQTFTGTAGGLTVTFSGTAFGQPTINDGPGNRGVVNAASFKEGPGVVPGSYISIFGTALSDTDADASAQPLPLAIGETSVSFTTASGKTLPGAMLHADDQQVNVQVPWELAGEQSVQIVVNLSDATSTPYTANVAPFSPAIYVRAGIAAAQDDPNFNLITSSNPAQRGHDIHLYVNGLGAVNNPPATGTPVPQGALVHSVSTPTVTVGGKNATVLFSGLAPLFPGLNQIDITVPADAPTGPQPVVVSIGGVSSPAVNMPVK